MLIEKIILEIEIDKRDYNESVFAHEDIEIISVDTDSNRVVNIIIIEVDNNNIDIIRKLENLKYGIRCINNKSISELVEFAEIFKRDLENHIMASQVIYGVDFRGFNYKEHVNFGIAHTITIDFDAKVRL